MNKLIEKLEALVDEAKALVREERQRRALALNPPAQQAPYTVPAQPYNPGLPYWLQGPTCTTDSHPKVKLEAWNGTIDTGCAPSPFVGSTVTICDMKQNAILYGNH